MANNFQKGLSFKTVDDLLTYLPDEELRVVEALRKIILECIPDCTEKIRYNVPFYARHQNFCYVWPSSVPWGKIKNGVALGFTKGYLLSDQMVFKKTDHKQIRSLTFSQTEAINYDIIKSLINEAIEIDEECKRINKIILPGWKDNSLKTKPKTNQT